MARRKRPPFLIAYHGRNEKYHLGGGGGAARERGLRASERLDTTSPQQWNAQEGNTRKWHATARDSRERESISRKDRRPAGRRQAEGVRWNRSSRDALDNPVSMKRSRAFSHGRNAKGHAEMTVAIRKAKRSATKLRLLLTGPSGSGKTWGALQIAKGIGGKTVVIDTEEGSSDLYDHLHDFDVIDLRPPFSPERYIEAITAAEQAGYEVIIVDSVTHCWSGAGGCLELLEDVAKAQFRGNTWSAFSVITPRWRAFVDKLLRSPAHIICSGRSKTETAQVDDHGKKKVAKLGMKLEARDGLEFEFTCVLDVIHDGHYATTSKDRTGLFVGDPKPITEETGKRLAQWLAGATPAENTLLPTIKATIDNAPSLTALSRIGDRIDVLYSEGTLTNDDVRGLTQKIDNRAAALRPATK